MRASAIGFAQEMAEREDVPDMILASDYLDVATFRALLPARIRDIPILTYFHENQLTYPVKDESERDYQFVFTNITTCLASDRVLIENSSSTQYRSSSVECRITRLPESMRKYDRKAVSSIWG